MLAKADRLRVFLYGELLTSGFVVSPKLLAAPMQLWRRQLRAISDPELRAKCVPDYLMGCKRVLFSDDWYPTLTRPNVELVTDPIERIDPDGVVTAGGATRPADVLVYATGFKTLDFLAPMSVTGLGGRRLQAEWRDGAQAYLGITVSGFPNFFMLYGPNTNLGGNSIIYMLEGQIGYVLGALQALEAERLAWLDVRPEVQRAFNFWVESASRSSVWQSGCHSWYTTATGRNTNNWPDQTFRYRRRVRQFDLAGYRVMPKRAGRPAARGMISRRAVRGLPCRLRWCASGYGSRRALLDPELPWPVQRTRLDQVSRISLLRRGTRCAAPAMAGVPAELVPARASGPQRTVVHFHGGGYCIGSAFMARAWAAQLSAQAGCQVILPEYRLAPGHPYPAALQDARAVLKALTGEVGGARPGRICVRRLGRRRDSPWPWPCRCATGMGQGRPAGCILLSPWLDLGRDRRASPDLVRRDVLLSPGWLDACARAYTDPPNWADHAVSPLHATHCGLPPLLIQAGDDELLAPDAGLLAASASAAGVDVTYTRWPRMWHDFALQPGLVAAADSALAQAAWFVGKVTASS